MQLTILCQLEAKEGRHFSVLPVRADHFDFVPGRGPFQVRVNFWCWPAKLLWKFWPGVGNRLVAKDLSHSVACAIVREEAAIGANSGFNVLLRMRDLGLITDICGYKIADYERIWAEEKAKTHKATK